MPSLKDHHGSDFVKALYVGNSGSGKTGSLVSLVKSGYKLRILDLDNGLDALSQFIFRECPDKVDMVHYENRQERYKASPSGPVVAGQPKAFTESLKLMTTWSDGTDPGTWGADTIFVLDSLSALGIAALEWAKGMNPLAKDGRQWYRQAQMAIENVLALLTSPEFKSNVIVITHVKIVEERGVLKGIPNSVGSAIGNIIPRYFNTMMMAQMQGIGDKVTRTIQLAPTSLLELKNPVPFKLEKSLPLETGLSKLFETLKQGTKNA